MGNPFENYGFKPSGILNVTLVETFELYEKANAKGNRIISSKWIDLNLSFIILLHLKSIKNENSLFRFYRWRKGDQNYPAGI